MIKLKDILTEQAKTHEVIATGIVFKPENITIV